MEPCFFEEYIREADKKLLARHSVTPLSASEEMKDDSLNVPRSSLHYGTLGVKSYLVSATFCEPSPHKSTVFSVLMTKHSEQTLHRMRNDGDTGAPGHHWISFPL